MHRITQWGEYGVHVVLFLAQKMQEGQVIVGGGEISESQNIALNYTQQILLRLKTHNIVESVRGPKGGYCLSKKPCQISIQEILIATEGDTASIICESNKIDHENCGQDMHCSLKNVWYGLKAVINSYLSSITVQDLLDDKVPPGTIDTLVHLPVNSTHA